MIRVIPFSEDEIRKAMKLVKSNALNADIDTLKEMLIPIFRGYVHSATKVPVGEMLYRGVKCKQIPDNIKQLTYPPKDKAHLGRANRDGNPVFYCSNSGNVTCFELDVKPGDMVAVSKWRIAEPLLLNNVGFTDGVFLGLNANRRNPNYGEIKSLVDVPLSNALVDKFLSEEFMKSITAEQRDLYKLPVAIAEKLFMDKMFDGLLYPTFAMRGNADNLAIKPTSVEKKLVIRSAEFIQINSQKDFTYNITRLNFAKNFGDDGTIQWKGRPANWKIREQGDELLFSMENGEWIARDAQGNIVEPD